MRDIAAYLTFVLATLLLIFSTVVAASLSIATYETTKWIGRCLHTLWSLDSIRRFVSGDLALNSLFARPPERIR